MLKIEINYEKRINYPNVKIDWFFLCLMPNKEFCSPFFALLSFSNLAIRSPLEAILSNEL